MCTASSAIFTWSASRSASEYTATVPMPSFLAVLMTRQAISQHLDVLEEVGLVTTKREGRYKFHYLDTTPLNVIYSRWLKPSRKKGER